MARKSMKDAAAAGTSVFEQIANGNTQPVQPVKNVEDVQDVQNTTDINKGRKPKPDKIPMERLNLKIPTAIKEYLIVAAAEASIEQRRNVSLTEYLCDLVTADMEKHKDQ